MNKRQDRVDEHLKPAVKAWQKEYQAKYRAKNREKSNIESIKWMNKACTGVAINKNREWSDKDISLVMSRNGERWKYTIKTLMKKLGRTYNAIGKVRQGVKLGNIKYRHIEDK